MQMGPDQAGSDLAQPLGVEMAQKASGGENPTPFHSTGVQQGLAPWTRYLWVQ